MDNLFYIYILKCSDNSFYIGHTDDLEKRIYEHKSKKFDGYTSTKLPIELVFKESFPTREEALIAEHKIKKWTHKKKSILIEKGWAGIKGYSKKYS